MPYSGLIGVLEENPHCLAIWCRRSLWRPDASSETTIRRESAFDVVIEPGELAAIHDRGLTTKYRSKTRLVDPIRILDDDEILDRNIARNQLNIAPGKTAVLLQLGAGNNYDYSEIRSLIISHLLGEKDVQVAALQWMISNEEVALPCEVNRITTYPIARYLKAFDFVISAAGYNSFHELLTGSIPTIFVPNENVMMDEQISRAKFAEQNGLGLCLRAHEVYNVRDYLTKMLDHNTRSRFRARCDKLPRANGANEVARTIEELVSSVRSDMPSNRRWTIPSVLDDSF